MSKTAQSDKERLEAGVAKVGKVLTEAVKIVEGSKELTVEQVNAAFTHISHLLLTAHQKAQLSVSLAMTVNGGFSLDSPTPAPVLTSGSVDMVHVPIRIPNLVQTERLAGERKKKSTTPDDDPNVGFIDE